MIMADEVIDYLLGSCESVPSTARIFRLSEDDVRKAITNSEIECCETCGYWFDKIELEQYEGDFICNPCLDK